MATSERDDESTVPAQPESDASDPPPRRRLPAKAPMNLSPTAGVVKRPPAPAPQPAAAPSLPERRATAGAVPLAQPAKSISAPVSSTKPAVPVQPAKPGSPRAPSAAPEAATPGDAEAVAAAQAAGAAVVAAAARAAGAGTGADAPPAKGRKGRRATPMSVPPIAPIAPPPPPLTGPEALDTVAAPDPSGEAAPAPAPPDALPADDPAARSDPTARPHEPADPVVTVDPEAPADPVVPDDPAVTVDPEAPADPVVAAEAVVTAAPAAPEVSEAPDVTAAPPTAVEPADQPDPVAMAPDSPPPDIPPADGLPADEPPAEAVPAAAVDLAADGPADPGPADGGEAPAAHGVPAKLPVPLPAIEIVIGSRALATPVDEVTAEYPTVALPPDEPPPPDAGPVDPGPRPARRGMSRRTIVGAVALSSVVIAATGAIAHVINPDLARMPPIMRVPKEPKPQAAPAPLVAPANPSPSPSARPKPKQTKATVVPTTPGSPVNAPPTGPTTEAFLLAAEAEGAEHSSQPRPRAVAGASGGQVMGHLGQFDEYLRFRFTVPTAGQYTVTVYYCGGEARPMRVRVNDNSIRENGTSALSFGATGSWDTVGSRAFQVTLRAGANTVELWNVNPNWAPDIDRLTVTR